MAVRPSRSASEIWDSLLAWLAAEGGSEVTKVKLVETQAGRGLVALEDVPAGRKLISIAPSSLLNTNTLRSLYPSHFTVSLTATQWISLHISLQYTRHASGAPSAPSPRDKWWEFLRSLPESFPTVPLSWSIARRTRKELLSDYGIDAEDDTFSGRHDDAQKQARYSALLAQMPASVRTRAEAVEKRFKADWLKTKEVWSKERKEAGETDRLLFFDYLLGWLNVNTRCVYLDLGRNSKASDNLTLAPVIDMINHQDNRLTKPVSTIPGGLYFPSPPYGSKDPPLRAGDELSFSYGGHEDAMLLTEYGFTLGTNPFNNVDIDRHIAELFNELGEEGSIKRGLLQDNGYWAGMTLQPTSASWRVLVALRLLHLKLPATQTTAPSATALAPWFAVINGDMEVVSHANEGLVSETLRVICAVVLLESDEGLPKAQALRKTWEKDTTAVDDDLLASLAMVEGVWKSERRIADDVSKGLTIET